MAVDVDFLERRVAELEKKYEVLNTKIQGTVSDAAVQRLMVLRQDEYLALKTELDRLTQIVNNIISNP